MQGQGAMSDSVDGYAGVTVLEGLSGMRRELSMYLGSTGVIDEGHMPRALTQMAQEVVSNALDEHVAGFGDNVIIIVHEDESMSVIDFGRGMPKGPGRSFDDAINALTKSHASGKFDDKAYAALGVAGMHGIGLKAVNAGSSHMHVHAISHKTRLKRDGTKTTIDGFEEWSLELVQDTVINAEIIDDDVELSAVKHCGTEIRFWPDDGPTSETDLRPVIEDTHWIISDLEPRFDSAAFLMNGVTLELIDERSRSIKTWHYDDGIVEHVMDLIEGQTRLKGLKSPISVHGNAVIDDHMFEVNAALMFTDEIGSYVESYANGVPTREGGPHLDGFVQALVSAVNTHGSRSKALKRQLTDVDVLDGLTAVFEVKVPSEIADFEGQTKEKLGTAQAKNAVHEVIFSSMLDWMSDNSQLSDDLMLKMCDAAASRIAAIKAKKDAQVARRTRSKGISYATSSKLKSASSRDPTERELYITEGDSASNIGRDTRTQAVFPIRGKILNVFKSKSLAESLKSMEISTIVSVLGAGVSSAFDINDMQYHKIILAADGDADGGHIRSLLTGIFFKFFPGLIDAGRLYIVEPPLYRAVRYVKGKPVVKMFYTEQEIASERQSLINDGYDISRYKGLGEMNPDEAKRALTAPATRRMVRVSQSDARASAKTLHRWLGDNAALRRQWIEDNIDFDEYVA